MYIQLDHQKYAKTLFPPISRSDTFISKQCQFKCSRMGEPFLKDHPIGLKNVVSQDSPWWSLGTGSFILYCSYIILQEICGLLWQCMVTRTAISLLFVKTCFCLLCNTAC